MAEPKRSTKRGRRSGTIRELKALRASKAEINPVFWKTYANLLRLVMLGTNDVMDVLAAHVRREFERALRGFNIPLDAINIDVRVPPRQLTLSELLDADSVRNMNDLRTHFLDDIRAAKALSANSAAK